MTLNEKEFCDSYNNYIKSVFCSENREDSDRICREIISHKKSMDRRLERDVGIDVAILDYITNINKKLQYTGSI